MHRSPSCLALQSIGSTVPLQWKAGACPASIWECSPLYLPTPSPHPCLALQDLDSTVPIMVEGHKLERGKRVPLKPGCVMQCGDDVAFQVLRNVFAHA
jgi:hypothetical protein